MTYYAVTNDPNELMHFGIKGMKWGVTRTPEQLGHHKTTKARTTRTAKPKENKPRSPAYQKASAKLSQAMRAGIAKAQANWKEYNSPYNKAQREYNRALKRDERAYKRNEKAFQKHLQLAREGRLKYKGISDEEVGRITDRLALERSSRLLSGTEKQSFGRRLKERVGEGIIEGAGRGVSGYVAERMTARGRAIGEIKAERRKARAENSLIGRHYERLKENKLDRQSDRQMEREADRINYLYKHNQQRKDTEKKAKKDARLAEQKAEEAAREAAETNYLAAVEENRTLGYDRALGPGTDAYARLHGFSVRPKDIKRLSVAELKGRTAAIDETAKLYSKTGDARIKALYGGKDVQARDDDGNPLFDENGDPVMQTTYSGGSSGNKGSKGKKGKNGNRPSAQPHPDAGVNRPHDPLWDDATDVSRFNRPVTPNMVNNYSHQVRRTNKQQFERATAGANTMDELYDQIRANEAASRSEKAASEEADRQWRSKQRDMARRQAERKQARDEGFAFYAARRESRENNPDEYLPFAPTRAQVKADPTRYLPDLGSVRNRTGSSIGNPRRQSWRVTRTQTRKRNYR